ncbi:MAG TPA: glycosyltransferase [Ktedonobacteraceae bacterium]|nr:glycosyltransferase [Ktedonobacteraceae bacterium]
MNQFKRIAFLSEHASPVALLGGTDAGGQNVYVDEMTRHLARLGYAVDVFTRRDSPETPEIIEWVPGVRVVYLSAGPASPLPKDDLWPLMPEFRDSFLSFVEREEIRYNLIHGNFWMSGWVATELRRRLGIPAIQIFHATGITKRRYQKQADTSPLERISVERDIVRDVDRLIAHCPSEWTELVNDYAADPRKVVTIPSGVDLNMFRPVERSAVRQRLGLDPDEKVIVYVGRLLQRKDIRNIVRALAVLVRRQESTADASPSPITLLVVGGATPEPDPVATPEIGELQQLAAELGVLDRVRFAGEHQHAELRNFYSAGDVAVTTPWYEPYGFTSLEAMACGRPVIGSAVGGLTYTIKHGESGFLVPPRDPEALADRLQQLFSHPELCAQMGFAARKRVEREFAWPQAAMRTATLYNSLIETANPVTVRSSYPLPGNRPTTRL